MLCCSLAGLSSATAVRSNTRPTTDARSATARSDVASCSSRAARRAEIVGGTATAPTRSAIQVPSLVRSRGSSRSMASISSTNNGFPSAASTTFPRRIAGSVAPSGRCSMRPATTSFRRGSRNTVVAFSLPPPHAGRSSRSSGRALHTNNMGTSARPNRRCTRSGPERSTHPNEHPRTESP